MSLLKNQNIVSLNTGRSLSWTQERVINPLVQKIEDKRLLENFIAVGEKGADWLVFEEGKFNKVIDPTISVPKTIQTASRKLSEKFSDNMFFDETKETMISIEMADGGDIDEFGKNQKELIKELKHLLKELSYTQNYRIDPSKISTDIQHKGAGKALGARRIASFIKQKSLSPKKYICFGDSKSDVEMAFEFDNLKLKTQMIYVGNPSDMADIEADFPISITKERFEKGTLEFLQAL